MKQKVLVTNVMDRLCFFLEAVSYTHLIGKGELYGNVAINLPKIKYKADVDVYKRQDRGAVSV